MQINILKSAAVTFLSLAAITVSAQTAHFSMFSYQGHDERFNVKINPKTQYLNPVVSGYYPDPSILRVGDTYWLANSTFGYFPGVPLFKSHDLVNWKQVGNVLDRPSQLKLNHTNINTGGIYAPQLSYNPKNKTYYMTTMNMSTYDVFYVKSKDPEKGWSDPVHMKYGGMDTSFFFDKNGKAYVVYNAGPFAGSKYDGQTAIHMNEFDWKHDSIMPKTYELTTGSTCIKNPKCIEGPHLLRVGKYYYLLAAEGGTEHGHSEVVFRSRKVTGPYEEFAGNPIITQRDLTDNDRPDMVTNTGHVSMVKDKKGQWWAAFLGCRPYESDDKGYPPYYGELFNTGRETFLLPVTWKDGWPVILEHGKAVPTVVNKEGLTGDESTRPTGNYKYTDNFTSTKPDFQWLFINNPDMKNYKFGNGLDLTPVAYDLSDKAQPTALLFRQKNTSFTVETSLTFAPENTSIAGLALMQNEKNNVVVGKTLVSGKQSVVICMNNQGNKSIIASSALSQPDASLRLKVVGDGRYYSFSYAEGNGSWQTLAKGVDCSNLSTPIAGGFAGVTIGPYASLKNKE